MSERRGGGGEQKEKLAPRVFRTSVYRISIKSFFVFYGSYINLVCS